jgi:hypothetical protein
MSDWRIFRQLVFPPKGQRLETPTFEGSPCVAFNRQCFCVALSEVRDGVCVKCLGLRWCTRVNSSELKRLLLHHTLVRQQAQGLEGNLSDTIPSPVARKQQGLPLETTQIKPRNSRTSPFSLSGSVWFISLLRFANYSAITAWLSSWSHFFPSFPLKADLKGGRTAALCAPELRPP